MYGQEEGPKRHNDWIAKATGSYENFVVRFGENAYEKWVDYLRKFQSNKNSAKKVIHIKTNFFDRVMKEDFMI